MRYMAVASRPAGQVLAGPVFCSLAQRGFTLVGDHVMGGHGMHLQIHYLSCSAVATELYLSCVAMSQYIPEEVHQPRDFNLPQHFQAEESSYAFFPANLVWPVAIVALL